jgi:hypothetical protein
MGGGDATSAPPVQQTVLVTRDADRGPKGCHPENVGQLVVDFFTAVNRRQPERVTDIFTPQLGWYSITEYSPKTGKRHFVAYAPAKLQRYFEGRISKNERLYLLEMDVAYERSRKLGHISYVLRRTGDDLDRYGDVATGKGAIDCETGRIAVWSMAHDSRHTDDAPAALCPGDAEPPNVAVVCSRA